MKKNRFVLVFVVICAPILFVFFLYFHEDIKNLLKSIMVDIAKLPRVFTWPLFIALGLAIIMIGLPISYYEFLIGFTLENIFEAFSLSATIKILGTFFTYILAKRFFRDFIMVNYGKKIVFRGIKMFIEEKLILHLIYIRLLYIPLFIKNYVLPIFDIPPLIYFCVTIPIDVAAGFWMIFLGHSINNFVDFNQERAESWKSYAFFAISLLIFAYIFVFTKKKIGEFKTLPQKTIKKRKFLIIKNFNTYKEIK